MNPTQVNVQVPWELQGQKSVQVKVTDNFSASNIRQRGSCRFFTGVLRGIAGDACSSRCIEPPDYDE